jgi:phosphatidylglycerophosphate synthase
LMNANGFGEAHREMGSILTSIERRCLLWLASRVPLWINSDHLTAAALFSMMMVGLSYYLARGHRLALLLAIAWLAIHWLCDSLDGTVARVRQQQRPRYGFYVDHVVDCFGVLFLVSGLAVSGYMSPLIALGVLVAYFLLSIEVYLATYCLTVFRMSFWGIGPTELRVLLAIGTLALLSDPKVSVMGQQVPLFDVGGLVAIASMTITAVVSVARNTGALYRAEPLPPARG